MIWGGGGRGSGKEKREKEREGKKEMETRKRRVKREGMMEENQEISTLVDVLSYSEQ